MSFQKYSANYSIPERLCFSIKTGNYSNIKEILKSVDDPSIYFKIVIGLNHNIQTEFIKIFFDKAKNKLEFLISLINSKRDLFYLYRDIKYIVSIDDLEGEVCYLLCFLYNRIVSRRKEDYEKIKDHYETCVLPDDIKSLRDKYKFSEDDCLKNYLKMMRKTSLDICVEEEDEIIDIISPLFKKDILIFREEEIYLLLNCGAIKTILVFCEHGLNPHNYPNLKSNENYKEMLSLRKTWVKDRKEKIQESTPLDNDIISIILDY
jgi:hypothetical protein